MDFENLNFNAKFEEDKTDISCKSLSTKEDEALRQEATAQTAVMSCMETKDAHIAENADKEQPDEDFQGAGVMSMEETLEDDYTSSDEDYEQEGSVSGEDEEDEEEDIGTSEKLRDLLMSVGCDDEYSDGNKEDKIFAEGQPLALEGANNPQVRNEEQGDSESDEKVSYFERVPERGSEMMIKGDRTEGDEQEKEEDEQEESDSESEGMKVEQGENGFARHFEQEFENPCQDDPAKASLDFPEISAQNLEDLVAEVEGEGYVEKMKDFSGEEHQGPGESFADYPSDFSSCEYDEDGGKNKEGNQQWVAMQDTCLERAGKDTGLMGKARYGDEVGDEYLYSIDLEVDADKFRSLDEETGGTDRGKTENVGHMLGDAAVTRYDDGGESGESDSYSSSDGEAGRSSEELLENMCPQDLENNNQLEEPHDDARWNISDDYNRADPANFNKSENLDVSTPDYFLSEGLLTTEDTKEAETLFSDVTHHPAEDVNIYSVVQRQDEKTTSPSNQGSLDDSFFFESELEASEISELGQLGDDEYEEERNWEQEKERIKAFYEFYDDSDAENGREGEQR